MEVNVLFEEVKCWSCVLDTVLRREESQESIVSDSMPDIGTVISTTATPLLRACRPGEGVVTAEGSVAAAVLYQPEGQSGVCALSLSLPFQIQSDAPQVTPECRLNVSARITSAEVKLMNPRKILLRVEVAFHVLAFQSGVLRCSTGLDCAPKACMQTKMEQTSFQYIAQVTEKSFPYEDAIQLTGAHRTVAALLGWSAVPYCTETKIVGSKVVFRGYAHICMHLLGEDGQVMSEDYDLPISQVLDAGGASENARAAVSLMCTSVQLRLAEQNSVACELEFYASAILYDSRACSVLVDAYSTACPCRAERETETVCGQAVLGLTTVPLRCVLEQEHPVAELVGQSVFLAEAVPAPEGGGVHCRLRASVCMRDGSGYLSTMEKSCTADCAVPGLTGQNGLYSVSLLDAACVSTVSGLELRGTLSVQYIARTEIQLSRLSTVTMEQPPENDRADQPSAVLRMLRDGETLWDLGKEYYATVEDIMAVNQISDAASAAGRFLLIPRSR